MRGKTFEGTNGTWEKIEFELTEQDLLPAENESNATGHPMLLELRAEQNIVYFMKVNGFISEEEALKKFAEISTERDKLLKKPSLKGK